MAADWLKKGADEKARLAAEGQTEEKLSVWQKYGFPWLHGFQPSLPNWLKKHLPAHLR